MKVIICNIAQVLSFALPAFFSNSENTGPTTETPERDVSPAVGCLVAAFLSEFLQRIYAFVEQRSLAGATLLSSVFPNTNLTDMVGFFKNQFKARSPFNDIFRSPAVRFRIWFACSKMDYTLQEGRIIHRL